MSQARIAFILAYRFADSYDTEVAWQRDFDRFKAALAEFDRLESAN